jgi:hypothetical protein
MTSIINSAIRLCLLTLVILINKEVQSCSDLTASNLSSLTRIFRDCGVAVYETDNDIIRPSRKTFVERLPDTDRIIEVKHPVEFPQHEYYFSELIDPLFPNQQFPAFTIIAAEATDSVDVEVCLMRSGIPCKPENFRFVQLEEADAIFIDPTRSRMRFCDAENQQKGCILPRNALIDSSMYRSEQVCRLEEVSVEGSLPEGEVLGDRLDHESLYNFAESLLAKQERKNLE